MNTVRLCMSTMGKFMSIVGDFVSTAKQPVITVIHLLCLSDLLRSVEDNL